MIQRYLAFLFVAVFTAGCSSLKDTSEPPAELTKFDEEVAIKKQWAKDIGKGAGEFLLPLEPVVTATMVYAIDRKGKVSAFDRETGKVMWRAKVKRIITSSLGMSGDVLVAATKDGVLLGIEKESGNIKWEVQLTGEVLGAPVADVNVIVVQTVDGAISGVSADTGEIIWTNRRNVPPLTLRGTGQPVLERGLVITGMDSGRLMAFSLLDGRVVWEAPLGVARGRNEIERIADADIKPVVDQGLVYGVSYQGRLAALALDTGRIVWARDMSAYQGVGKDDFGAIYVVDEHSQVWSIDKRTGATLWKQDKLRARSLTAPQVLGDHVVTMDFEGVVHVLHTSDGRLVARKQFDDAAYVLPAIIDQNQAIVLDSDGDMTVFSLETLSES